MLFDQRLLWYRSLQALQIFTGHLSWSRIDIYDLEIAEGPLHLVPLVAERIVDGNVGFALGSMVPGHNELIGLIPSTTVIDLATCREVNSLAVEGRSNPYLEKVSLLAVGSNAE